MGTCIHTARFYNSFLQQVKFISLLLKSLLDLRFFSNEIQLGAMQVLRFILTTLKTKTNYSLPPPPPPSSSFILCLSLCLPSLLSSLPVFPP